MSRKSVGINTGKEQRCPLDDPEARLTYKNTEGYADPTCFFALCNVMREEKAKKRAGRLNQNHSRDAPKPCHAAGGGPASHKSHRKRFNTQVIHYDERGNACCNQGGMVVVSPAYSIRPMVNTQTQQEQTPSLMARDSKDPLLVSLPSYCLDRACFTSGENAQYRLSVRAEVAATLVAEGPGAISAPPEEYLVRRLTPLECCRLQGFPDGWTEHLETEEPGEQEIARWVGVFEDWYRAQGKTARASPGKIAKWLKNPRTDSAEYKAYGNSVAVPCVFFVLAGVAWAENRGDET